MKSLVRVLAALALIALLPSLGRSQGTTDYSEMGQWVKDSQHQGNLPIGTKITMANWQQYKQFDANRHDQTVRRRVLLEVAA